jgi:hypothetical protein
MMKTCCGQPVRQYRPNDERPLARNPAVRGGVRMLYLGTGTRKLRGPSSGLEYVVGVQRRIFVVHRDDADALLRRRHFILAPPQR